MTKENTTSQHTDYSGKWKTLSAVMVGTFMAPLDASIVNTILPSFTQVFGADIALTQWIPSIYLLAICCLIMLFGRLGDMVGHRKIYIAGVGSFAAASLFCGLSQNIWMLITCRAFQGAAAALMMSVAPAIVTSAFPGHERGKGLGFFMTGIAFALATGPTLGGIITEYIGWRYVFFINVPVGISAVFLGLKAIPMGDVKKGQVLDWYGAITVFIFLFSILVFLNRVNVWGSTSFFSIMLLICASVSGFLFIRVEMKTEQPMINLRLFKNPVFAFGNLSMLINFIVAYTVVFLTPFYLTIIQGLPISRVGFVLATYPLVMMIVSPLCGILSDRIGYRILTVSGMLVCTVAMIMMSRLSSGSDVIEVVSYLLLFSLGTSLFLSPNSSAIMGSIPAPYLGIASGIMANMRNLGMVLGIALSGAVFYTIAPASVSGPMESLSRDQAGYMLEGFSRAYLTAAAVACTGCVTSFYAKINSHSQPAQ